MSNNKSLDNIIEEFMQQELPIGADQVTFDIAEDSKKECWNWQHQYINCGFHFDKFVCKVCNKEKPKE
jgi:hypothetical protein